MSGTGQLPELESLRTQLADVARELAERDRTLHEQTIHRDRRLQDLQEQSALLRTMVEGTATETGEQFFASLVNQLTSTLQVQYAMLGTVTEAAPRAIHTIAVSSGGTLVSNFEYALPQTPCETALQQSFASFDSRVQDIFPDIEPLARLRVDSYCGVPIRIKSDTVIGILAIMDTKPLRNSEWLQSVLTLFASRAGAEIQRQRAEITQRQAERRLRFTQFAVDQSFDGVLWADDSTRFIYANDAVCRSLGYSREELLGLTIADIAPRHDLEQFQQRLDEIKQGGAATYESVHRRKDGSEFPVEVSVTYLEYEGKGYTCGIIRDITERQRVEQERLQALTDLRNITETVPDFMFTLDTQGNMVKWNLRVEEVTGYSSEELHNKSALAFVYAHEQEHTALAIQRAFTDGTAELEGHLLTKDQRLIPYHWTGAVLKDPEGRIIGITGIGRDISAQKHAAEALQRQRQHLLKAQALAHLGSWEWDIASGETDWSEEQFRIFGHEPWAIAVTYDTFLAALLPDDHDRVLAAVNDALLGKCPLDLECRIVRPSGDIRVIHMRADVQRDATGHPMGMAGTALDITERKQIEEALRTSEERWHLAIQGNNDGIWDWNIQTGAIFFSARWKAMRGFADHEVRKHIDEWRSRIHPDDLDHVLQSLDHYLAKQTSAFCEEYRVQRKDGSYMWILDRGVALWAEDGTPVRMAGSETDITESKRAEEALAQSRNQLASFVEHTPAAVAMLDKDFRYLAVSRRWLQDYRLGDQNLIGKHHYDIFPEIRQMTEWQAIHQRCLAGAVERREEDRFVREDGSEDWLRWEIRPWHDVSGKISGIIMFTEVITERKRAEEALRISQEKLHQALQASRTGLWDWNTDSSEASFSREWKQQLGYKETELAETFESWEALLHPGDHDRVIAYVQAYLANPAGDYQQEFRLRHKDGTYRWIEARATFVAEPDGRRVRLLGSHTDITERKQAEHRLRLTQFMIDHAVEAIYWIDPHANIMDVNEAAREMLGYSKEDLCAMTVHDLNPDFQADMWPGFWAKMQQQGTMAFETSHRTRDGRLLPVEIQINYLSYEGQEFHCAFVRDITERKRAQEELRQSKTRLAYILESNPAVVYTRQVGNGWPFTFITPNVYKLLGYTSIDILTNPDRLDQSIHPDDDRNTMTTGMPQLLSNGAQTFVYRLRQRDGRYCWIENRARLADDGQGALQIVGTMLDITQRKRAEEALTTSEHQLRTALNERERISQDLHDGILQSLYAVGLGLEACKPLMTQQHYKKAAAAMDRAIGHLNHVMSEVRNFIAGLESQLLQGSTFPMALRTMVLTLTADHPIPCTLTIDESLADTFSTEQALHLLNVVREALSNSLRHAEATKTTVSLKSLSRSIRLTIADNGKGFDPASMCWAGHGLTNMEARARKVGGRFAIRSVLQHGTRITIDVPKETRHAESESEHGSTAARR